MRLLCRELKLKVEIAAQPLITILFLKENTYYSLTPETYIQISKICGRKKAEFTELR